MVTKYERTVDAIVAQRDAAMAERDEAREIVARIKNDYDSLQSSLVTTQGELALARAEIERLQNAPREDL